MRLLDATAKVEVLLHESLSTWRNCQRGQPCAQINCREEGKKEQPQPEEDKYFLHKHVDDEHTLNGVPVNVTQHANLKVAESNARKSSAFTPLAVLEKACLKEKNLGIKNFKSV